MHKTRSFRCGLFGLLIACLALLAMPTTSGAADAPILRVAYAGSMGAVMDNALGPTFAEAHTVRYQGIGQGSYALARLLAARQLRADVFIGVTPGPVKVLKAAGRIGPAEPIASTRMVLVYSPTSRFAADFAAAANESGKAAWTSILRQPGVRFGRTDPAIDPQGANALLSLQLAARYYHQPDLLEHIAGPLQNPRQMFTETSLMSRLEAGQIDATIGYLSAVRSHHLPYLELPAAVNLGDPSMDEIWYSRAGLELQDGKQLRAQPLVFYAAVLVDARQPERAKAFVEFLRSHEGQAILHRHGYSAPHGAAL